MKKTRAWVEKVSFVECPHCEETVELGSELVWGDEEEEHDCANCGQEFIVQPPKDER